MEPLEEGCFYHIYNRGAGKSDLFFTDNDFSLFIDKYFFYLNISAETYCWCLLKNHFHILIRVRKLNEQKILFQQIKNHYPEGTFYGDHFDQTKPFLASKQFSHLMNSYTKSVNTKTSRSGTLIEGTFKRKRIKNENHFNHLVCYIHRNPIHHKITENYSDYLYSSFHAHLDSSNQKQHSYLEKKKVLTKFGGIDNFLKAHEEFKLLLGEEYYLE